MGRLSKTLASALIACVLAGMPLAAQPAESPYAGKTLNLLIGTVAGGGYDLYARALARQLGKHIAGQPNVVAKNMPGAGSLVLANHLYALAPRDGLTFGALQRQAPLDPLLQGEASAAKFDAAKFTWIGSISSETGFAIVATSAGIDSFADLRSKELFISAQGGASDTEIMPRAINAVLGTRMKIITGYSGSPQALLALERGEVGGYFTGGWAGVRNTVEPWLQAGKVKLLVQISVRKSPEFPDLPLIMDFATTERERRVLELAFVSQIWGRPYAAPPDIPESHTAVLREAFGKTLSDAAFMSEIEKLNFTIDPLAGEEMRRMIAEVYGAPPDILAATRAALAGERR